MYIEKMKIPLLDRGRSVFFFLGTPVSSTNKSDRDDIAEIIIFWGEGECIFREK